MKINHLLRFIHCFSFISNCFIISFEIIEQIYCLMRKYLLFILYLNIIVSILLEKFQLEY